MKKLLYLFIGILSLTLFSCNDFLTVPSNSLMSDDQVFSIPDSANLGITAIYETFGENNSYRNRMWKNLGLNTDIEFIPGWSSNAPISLTSSFASQVAMYTFPNIQLLDGYNNGPTGSNPFNKIYLGIERCNLAIQGIRKYGKPAAGNDMGHYLGEALTLRAFFYYDLIKWWGDVPARFTPVTTATIYVPKNNRDSTYKQLITDLQEASKLMYSANESKLTQSTKRLCKDAARGLLARICLQAAGYSMRPQGTNDSEIRLGVSEERRKELYSIAREACRDIVNDGHYKLDPSFKNIFFEQCQDIDTHGREAIFQLPYRMGLRGQMVGDLGLARATDNVYLTNGRSVSGYIKVIPSFFYDFNPVDQRRDNTVVPYKIAMNTSLKVMEQQLSGVTYFYLAKWRAEWVKSVISSTDDGVSPIILRYADILLMFAEADLFLGGSEGKAKFDEVRARAFKMTVSDYTASSYYVPLTFDAIKQERAFEFCGENLRKYDLERWGILKTAIDQASQNLKDMRDGAGKYVAVPHTLYYKWVVNNAVTTGERELIIYGLNPGETINKLTAEPTGGWLSKTWAFASTSLPDEYCDHLYQSNPDKRQLLPFAEQVILTSNGTITNDYGYPNN